jgi:hypothetical protein
MSVAKRIGEYLRDRGLLTDAQIEQILVWQGERQESFGTIAAREFGVQEAELWRAWAMQVIDYCPRLSPARVNVPDAAREFLSAREAWTYRLLPIDRTENELVLVTTAERLPNAMALAQIRSEVPVIFALADTEELETAIRRTYGIDSPQLIIPSAA